MKTKLDRLLESIDPSKTLDRVSARVDSAFNSFCLEPFEILDPQTFELVLSQFFRHVENHVLRIRGFKQADEYDRSHVVMILHRLYGENGDKAAFKMVRTGAQGGIYRVLKDIADNMASTYAGNGISGRIMAYWESITLSEQLKAPYEYIEKYGDLLPSEMTEGSAVRIRVNFINVLKEHPKMIQRLRRNVR